MNMVYFVILSPLCWCGTNTTEFLFPFEESQNIDQFEVM